ncbi:MAG TPA: hypothetical protein DEP46_12910, partial [Blastocatellia bacterium]|nr:hypothetical protein [Blastocatellia bacterium]
MEPAGLDQNGRRSPGGKVVAKGRRRPFVAVAADIAGDELIERLMHCRNEPHIALVAGRQRLCLITENDEERNGGLLVRFADGG